MTRTPDPTVERDANMWPLLAAAILEIQGLSTLFYATFLPAPLTNAGIDMPVLGTMPFVWIALGTISIVAGNSRGIESSVGAKVESRPIRLPIVTACSIMASFGLSTGIVACAAATASMQGPKAEQVNRIASAPVAAA